MSAIVGDRIAVESERVGQAMREGEVLEVLQPGPDVHYRVRWADGHDTVFFPSGGNLNIVKRARRTKAHSA